MIDQSDFSKTFRHARRIFAGLFALAVVFYLASGLYVVEAEQRGVVIRFGQIVHDDVLPGIHYHWPWPVESIQRLQATEIRSLSIPFESESPEGGSAGELLTGDENLVQARLLLQYTIKHPRDYLTNVVAPDQVLQRLAQWSSIRHFASVSVDEALTTGRETIQGRLKQSIQQQADTRGLGIRLTSVQLQSIEPPSANSVASAFKSVASAREDKQKLVEEAAGERNRRLPKARGDAESLRRDAEAYAREVTERARGDSERFLAIWEEYRKAKSITAYRLYLENVEQIMARVKKLVINPEAEQAEHTGLPPGF